MQVTRLKSHFAESRTTTEPREKGHMSDFDENLDGDQNIDDYDMVGDTSSAQASRTRLEQYLNYENIPLSGEAVVKAEKGHMSDFDENLDGDQNIDDYDMVGDTSSAQASLTRLEQYLNYENIPLSGEAVVKNGLLVVSGSNPALTSNWAVCCTLNPPVLPFISPEEVDGLETALSRPSLEQHHMRVVAFFMTCVMTVDVLSSVAIVRRILMATSVLKIAITEKGFFRASEMAADLIISNILRICKVNVIGDVILFLGKLCVSLASALFAFLMLDTHKYKSSHNKITSPISCPCVLGSRIYSGYPLLCCGGNVD
uniref:Choline transporter-like protein n=1 Tax=Tanacetum cinerariifolium TaxID=118510 RepID=A0A6L2NWK5_TANCI|nr:choline transporter-like protein 2 [Tanacetum cinerariifolium]